MSAPDIQAVGQSDRWGSVGTSLLNTCVQRELLSSSRRTKSGALRHICPNLVDQPSVYSLGIWALFGLMHLENRNIWHSCFSSFGGLVLQTPRAQLSYTNTSSHSFQGPQAGRDALWKRGGVAGFEEAHICVW